MAATIAPWRRLARAWSGSRGSRRHRGLFEQVWLSRSRAHSEAEALALGLSVLVVSSLVPAADCEKLAGIALRASERLRNAGKSAYSAPECSAAQRLPLAELSHEADAQPMCDAILRRALALVEAHLPALASRLFGQSADLWESMQFTFSEGEPAVNVYYEGGEFKPHEDKQHLTVLVPLSDGFAGGGTAFWSAECGRFTALSSAPTAVLKPPRGSALLFGGEVTHAGRPVTSGVRVVFVASFTLSPRPRPG